MTYGEFVDGAEQNYQTNKRTLDRGEAYVNYLISVFPSKWDRIAGGFADPLMNPEYGIEKFLLRLLVTWNERVGN